MDKLTKEAIEYLEKEFNGVYFAMDNGGAYAIPYLKRFIKVWLSKAFKAGLEEGRKEGYREGYNIGFDEGESSEGLKDGGK